jgi:hypothetical protein
MSKENQVTTVVKYGYTPTIIEDNIDDLVAQVKREIAALNINQMEVSEDNKQTLKNTRADLNKKLLAFETERKRIKEIVLQPYTDFESLYDIKLKKVILDAVKELDDKVKSIEEGQKKQNEDYAKEYFDRKLASQPIRLANKFSDVKVDISLSTNNKRIREAIDKHFEKVSSALFLIDSHEHAARLQVLWEKNGYDIGVAMVKLSTSLLEEKKVKDEMPDITSMYPSQMTSKKTTVTQQAFVEPKIEVSKVELVAEEAFEFKLNITVTETQLAALTIFMEEKDIIFELQE